MAKIVIVGAGLAGLVVARELHEKHEVTVLEKARGVGGRMASRYADPYYFDHGAQFFTARSGRFKRFLQPMLDSGVIAIWHARFAELNGSEVTLERQWGAEHPHYVGVPNMNAVQKSLADSLKIETSAQVVRCERTAQSWRVYLADDSTVDADWLVVTAPVKQTADILKTYVDLSWSQPMKACFAMMLGFADEFAMDFDAARVLNADISWVSRNSSKPGRSDAMTVVVHATNAWADQHVDIDIDAAHEHLANELRRTTGIDASAAVYAKTHRWRYANIDRQHAENCLIDPNLQLGVCADWFIRGRVESAFVSARSFLDSFADASTID